MNPRPRVAAAVSAVMAGVVCPTAALATERGCEGVVVEADGGIRAAWPDVMELVQAELATRDDIDLCARVELHAEAAGARVSVALPDGRVASRRVERREDVMPTLQALLLVPDQERLAAEPTLRKPPAVERKAAPHFVPARSDRDQVSPPAAATRDLGIELSLITGARMGDGQFAWGAGALSFVEVNGWLLGFEGRVDSYQPLLVGDAETALELAVLAGKRFNLGSVALDLSAGPAVAMKGLAFSQTDVAAVSSSMPPAQPPPPPPPPPRSDPSTGPVPRLLLGVRLGFRPRSVVRPFIGIDGEVGPARSSDNTDPNSSRLPGYTLGLALGGTVGTP